MHHVKQLIVLSLIINLSAQSAMHKIQAVLIHNLRVQHLLSKQQTQLRLLNMHNA